MSALLDQFVTACQTLTAVRRFVVAYSGGMDSRVLLELAFQAQQASALQAPVSVVHVNHQLQSEADQWQAHCESQCQQLALPLTVLNVDVQDIAGLGLEAAAREARRRAWCQYLASGDVLLLAHHLSDQAETILYRLCRGTGPKGLQGMRPLSKLGQGKIYRPLLASEQSALQAFAQQQKLHWMDDPSNVNINYDRNFLRQEIIPRLVSRWPKVNSAIARAGALCGIAHEVSEVQTAAYLQQAKVTPQAGTIAGLSVEKLLNLPSVWRYAVLRRWLFETKAVTPSLQNLTKIEQEVLLARSDAKPQFILADHWIRRSQGILYVLSQPDKLSLQTQSLPWNLQKNRFLNVSVERQLKAHTVLGQGLQLSQAMCENLEVRLGHYGRKAKKIFQSFRVPTWNRANYPVIFSQGHLLAIVGLWYSPKYAVTATDSGWLFSEIIN